MFSQWRLQPVLLAALLQNRLLKKHLTFVIRFGHLLYCFLNLEVTLGIEILRKLYKLINWLALLWIQMLFKGLGIHYEWNRLLVVARIHCRYVIVLILVLLIILVDSLNMSNVRPKNLWRQCFTVIYTQAQVDGWIRENVRTWIARLQRRNREQVVELVGLVRRLLLRPWKVYHFKPSVYVTTVHLSMLISIIFNLTQFLFNIYSSIVLRLQLVEFPVPVGTWVATWLLLSRRRRTPSKYCELRLWLHETHYYLVTILAILNFKFYIYDALFH